MIWLIVFAAWLAFLWIVPGASGLTVWSRAVCAGVATFMCYGFSRERRTR